MSPAVLYLQYLITENIIHQKNKLVESTENLVYFTQI